MTRCVRFVPVEFGGLVFAAVIAACLWQPVSVAAPERYGAPRELKPGVTIGVRATGVARGAVALDAAHDRLYLDTAGGVFAWDTARESPIGTVSPPLGTESTLRGIRQLILSPTADTLVIFPAATVDLRTAIVATPMRRSCEGFLAHQSAVGNARLYFLKQSETGFALCAEDFTGAASGRIALPLPAHADDRLRGDVAGAFDAVEMPGDRLLFSAAGDGITLIDTRAWQVIDHWTVAGKQFPHDLRFDQPLNRVIVMAEDSTVMLDASTGVEVARHYTGQLFASDYDPASHTLLGAGQDPEYPDRGFVRVIDVDASHFVDVQTLTTPNPVRGLVFNARTRAFYMIVWSLALFVVEPNR